MIIFAFLQDQSLLKSLKDVENYCNLNACLIVVRPQSVAIAR